MNYRVLGDTGLRVSEIGFGTWGLGGDSGGAIAYGPVNDDTSRTALKLALEQGINFYDTSDLYGFGHSEKIIGEAFSTCRDEVIIATKGGFVDANRQDFSVSHLRRAVEESLRRLRTDYIDLYQFHSPAVSLLREQPEGVGLMNELKAAGKIRAWGFSARSPDEALTAVEEFSPSVIQVNFSLVDQRAKAVGLFDLCLDRKIGVIIRTPLCFGFLSGDEVEPQELNSSDHRRNWSPEQCRRWAEAGSEFSAAFQPLPGQTSAQMALRYCLSYAGVSTVIPGMLTVQHVSDNTGASGLGPLTRLELERIENLYESRTYFIKDLRPT